MGTGLRVAIIHSEWVIFYDGRERVHVLRIHILKKLDKKKHIWGS